MSSTVGNITRQRAREADLMEDPAKKAREIKQAIRDELASRRRIVGPDNTVYHHMHGEYYRYLPDADDQIVRDYREDYYWNVTMANMVDYNAFSDYMHRNHTDIAVLPANSSRYTRISLILEEGSEGQ